MKIAVVGQSRFSSENSPPPTLASLCRQFALMYPKPGFPPQYPQRPSETSEAQETEPHAWRNSDFSSAPESCPEGFLPGDSLLCGRSSMYSDLTFSRQSTNNFLAPPQVDENPRAPEGLPKDVQVSCPASIGGLSSCTEFSEEEVRLAEVNPVTFEVFGGSRQLKQTSNSGAPWPSPQEQSIDVGYPAASYGNQFQAPPRLADDADMLSDGEFSHPVVYVSECHCGGASSPGTSSMDVHHSSFSSEETLCSRVRLMCSYGGKIMARPADGKLRYVGGETRIVAVDRDIGCSKFMSKMAKFYDVPLVLKYQLPDEDLDALVSVSSDDDLQNMMEEYDKLESSGGVSRLRLFFFTSSAEYETSQLGLQTEPDDFCTGSDQRYIDAINGVAERFSGPLLEDHDVSSAAGIWSGPQVNTISGAPSAPSSCPSSPTVAPIIAAHLKQPGMGDVSSQILNDRLHKVSLHPRGFESSTQEVDQDGSGGFFNPSHCDHQYRLPVDSPRTHHDILESRGEAWRIAESGMHRVDSQTMIRQSEQHLDRGTVAEPWHDVQQPSEMLLPQRFILQQHKHIPQQPTPAAWQSQIDGNLGRLDTMQHLSDVHKQPQTFHQPHQAVQQHLQAAHLRPHQTMAGHDGVSWNNDHQAIPSFLQGSMQSHPQIPLGLGPAPPYQMGSTPASPRVAAHDSQGRCSCPQQHSQVHRGISVSLGDQSYNRRTHFMDQPTRKHGMPNSSRFYDNPNLCGEPLLWQQPPNHFIGPEAEQQEQIGSPWQHFHDRNNAQCHLAECQLKTPTSQFCDPTFAETFLPSHDLHEPHHMRCRCISCHEHRRQHAEKAPVHPVFTDVNDQMGDWVMHQRTLELDDGRNSAVGRAVGKILPNSKEEDWRGEIEGEKRPEGELDSYFTHGQGDLKRVLAMPGGGVHHARFPVHVVPPASRPLVSEDPQVSQPMLTTLAHGEAEWHSKLPTFIASAALADSWSSSALEPRVRSDILPSMNSRPPHRIMEEVVNGISLGNVALVADGTNCLDKNSVGVGLFAGKHDQACDFNTTGSYMQDDFGMPSTAGRAVGEAATELLPVPAGIRELLESGYDGDCASAANKHPLLLSCDPIPMDSFALSQAAVPAAHAWKAFPPGTLSMTALEGSLSTSALPVYDQSPLSSMNATDFSFEPIEVSCTPGGANHETEACAPRISITRRLADDTVSSVLESRTNKGGCEDRRDANEEVNNKNSQEFQKSEMEDDTGKQLEASNSLLPPIVPGNGFSFQEADTANDWLRLSIDKEQLAGVVPAMQTDVSNEIMYEEKHVQVGSVCTKGPVCTQAELDAIAHGLQMIKNADLEDLKELGSGTFGTVFHGKWRGSDVAIKRIKASCFTGQPSEQERLISDFWKEALTLGQLHHPNIVAFYGVVPDGPEGTLATVTEYMVNGSLKQVLHKKDRTIDRRKRLLIAMDAAFGMEYLHSKNIVHFDLKCENLLVNMKDAHRPICKVGDFGLSKVKHQTLVSGGVRGTLPWMAPELLTGNSSMVTEKIDIFSFGIVMWELLTGEEPYANMHCGAIIGGIVNSMLRPPIPGWCDPGWRNLMERCWAGDPAERPSFSEVARELRAIAASINVK